MRKAILAALLLIIISVLSGCGSGGGSVQVTTPTSVAQILSDPTYDGDIAQDPVSGAFTVTASRRLRLLRSRLRFHKAT